MEPLVPEVGELSEYIHQYKLPIFLGLISIASIFGALFFIFHSVQNNEPIEFVMGDSTSSGVMEQRAEITVDVGGGVNHPGVYKIPVGSVWMMPSNKRAVYRSRQVQNCFKKL